MLPGRALDPDAVIDKPLNLRLVDGYPLLLKVLHDVTVNRLVSKRTDRSGTENVLRTEKLFCVLVYLALNLAREVKVYIRRFVSVESEERLKRYIVTVPLHYMSAARAVLLGQVETGADRAVLDKFGIAALGAAVMRGQRVYLCNSRHRCDE